MNLSKIGLPLLLLAALFLGSCAQRFYAPISNNVPLLQAKGEGNITASYGGGEEVAAAALKGAYAPTKNIGIILNAFHAYGGDNAWHFNSTTGQRYKGKGQANGIEVGVGYFKKMSSRMLFDVYGGMGYNEQKHSYADTTRMFGIHFNAVRFFVQPSLGYISKYFEADISSKMSTYLPRNHALSGGATPSDFAQYNYTLSRTSYYVEPTITLRAGLERLKFQAQFSFCAPIHSGAIAYDPIHFSAGINYHFKK